MEISREAYHRLIQVQWEARDKTNDTEYLIDNWNTKISAKLGEIAMTINEGAPDQGLLVDIVILADFLRSWYWTISDTDFNKAVEKERKFQKERWGEQEHSRRKWFMIAAEEAGEIAQEIEGTKTGDKYPISEIIAEIVQLSAILEAWVTSHDWFYQKEKNHDNL